MTKTEIKKKMEKMLGTTCREVESTADAIIISGIIQYPNQQQGSVRFVLDFKSEMLEIRLLLNPNQYPINIDKEYYAKMGIRQDVIDNYVMFTGGEIRYDDIKLGQVSRQMDKIYRLVMYALCIDIFEGDNDMQTVFGQMY